MPHIFQIQEQTIEDPSTKLRLEFSSIHSDELKAGNEAPLYDNIVLLRLWTSDKTRLATFFFERNGRFIRSEIEPIGIPLAQLAEMPASVPMGITAPGDVGPVTFDEKAIAAKYGNPLAPADPSIAVGYGLGIEPVSRWPAHEVAQPAPEPAIPSATGPSAEPPVDFLGAQPSKTAMDEPKVVRSTWRDFLPVAKVDQ